MPLTTGKRGSSNALPSSSSSPRVLTGSGPERLFWARTGNNSQKPSISAIFGCQFPAYQSRAHARERQVFRARAESPNAAGGTSRLTDPLLKSKNYSRKLCG